MSGVTIEPLGDRVLVEVLPLPEQSAGGVVFAESSRERSQRGLVLGVGPGRYTEQGALIPMGIGINDVVVFSKYGGTELPDGAQTSLEKQLLILRESDVLGIERQPPIDGVTRAVARICNVCGCDTLHHDRGLHETRDEPIGEGESYGDERVRVLDDGEGYAPVGDKA